MQKWNTGSLFLLLGSLMDLSYFGAIAIMFNANKATDLIEELWLIHVEIAFILRYDYRFDI